MRTPGTRATPLPPQQRRDGIVDAALPLLRLHGDRVTTKQIAEAAGIAEGTLFRVFADKESVILAVVAKVFDTAPTVAELQSIDMGLPLRERLRQAVETITDRLQNVWDLMSALRMVGPPGHNPRFRSALPSEQRSDLTPRALIDLIAPDATDLRVDVEHFTRVLRLVTFAGTHPRISDENPLKPDEIVDLLLEGLRAHAP